MAKDTYRGDTNNKEPSKEKLIEAVGTIIEASGYTPRCPKFPNFVLLCL